MSRTATPDTRRALRACAACGLIDAPYYDADGLCPLCSPEFDERHGPNGKENIIGGVVILGNTPDTNKEATELQRRALDAISTYGGVRPAARELSKKLGVKMNHGVIALAAKGKDIPQARRALGLPPKPVPVYPCPECGQVHKQLKSCKPSRKRGKHKMVFELDDAEFEHVRAFVGRYPKGRRAWILEKTGWEP